MKLAYGCINYNIKHQNTATDSTAQIRTCLFPEMLRYGSLDIVTPIVKKSQSYMKDELCVNYNRDSEEVYDVLLVEGCSTAFLYYNKYLEQFMDVISRAKNVFYVIHDVRYVIPEAFVQKAFKKTFWTPNVRGVLTLGTQFDEIRKDKLIPDYVPIIFAPISKEFKLGAGSEVPWNFKSPLGFVGNCHNIRKKEIMEILFNLPEEIKPTIYGEGYSEFGDREDIVLMGYYPPEIAFSYNKVMPNIQDKNSDKYGWLPSKLCDAPFNDCVLIFNKRTSDKFLMFEKAREMGLKIYSYSNQEEFKNLVEMISNWSEDIMKLYIEKTIRFVNKYCSSAATMETVISLLK